MKKSLQTALVLFGCVFLMTSQVLGQGTVRGIVIDRVNNEPMIAATIQVEGTTLGTVTDFDGTFTLPNVPAGTQKILCTYIGYESQTKEVSLESGSEVTVDFSVSESAGETLQEITVTAKAQQQSAASLVTLTRKSTSIVTGLSQDDFRKTPDRSTSDVLKRVSGTSIQDNKFVVIRGLSDRYNNSLFNGFLLPSTESDRRAFSFDIIPSALLDNLIIYKTASAEIPGEFAGGVVLLNTKEIPENDFIQISVGTSLNSQSTFEPYTIGEQGGTDWLGYDDGTRELAIKYSTEEYLVKQEGGTDARYEQSRLFENDWQLYEKESMPASFSLQLSGAKRVKLGDESDLGVIAGLTYNSSPRIIKIEERANFVSGNQSVFLYEDIQNKLSNTWSGLLNFGLQLNPRNRILFNNVYSMVGENRLTTRTGENIAESYLVQANSNLYNSTKLYAGQLQGEHTLDAFKLKWGLSVNDVNRSTPNMRNMLYFSDLSEVQYFTPITSTPSNRNAGRYFGDQHDQTNGASVDVAIPYTIAALGGKSTLKAGVFVNRNTRDFTARWFGAVLDDNSQFNLNFLPQDSLFLSGNMPPYAWEENTQKSDSYEAESSINGGYVMVDHNVASNFRVILGLRAEIFNQKLNSFESGASGNPVNTDTTYTDLLPSFNATYDINEKMKVRIAASQTVSRPNFREIAPFTFYNFDGDQAYLGNPNLVRTKITNFDARYEFYPANNQLIAFTAFFKKFDNPIEQIADVVGSGAPQISYQNVQGATNFGAELEARYSPLENLTVLGNFALIRSEVDLSNVANVANQDRELQGQSPYVLNIGANYVVKRTKTTASLFFNQIGRRIWQVSSAKIYKDVYENPRGVLDFTLIQKITDNGELKITVSDILNKYAIFYQDQNNSNKYEEENDNTIQKIRYGTNYGVTFSYRLSK